MPRLFDELDFGPGGGWGEAPPIVLPRDLDRAIAFARFSRRARGIIQQVGEACWRGKSAGHPPAAASCPLDLAALAAATGFGRRPLVAARRNLVAGRVLIRGNAGDLRIKDRIEEWTHPRSGRPRLSPKLVAFCRADSSDLVFDRKEAP